MRHVSGMVDCLLQCEHTLQLTGCVRHGSVTGTSER